MVVDKKPHIGDIVAFLKDGLICHFGIYMSEESVLHTSKTRGHSAIEQFKVFRKAGYAIGGIYRPKGRKVFFVDGSK